MGSFIDKQLFMGTWWKYIMTKDAAYFCTLYWDLQERQDVYFRNILEVESIGFPVIFFLQLVLDELVQG